MNDGRTRPKDACNSLHPKHPNRAQHEAVYLVREPQNPYDRYAIKALNVSNEMVGHVPAVLSALLAPIMDAFAETDFRVEGLVPNPAQNVYSMPLILNLRGSERAKARVQQLLAQVRARIEGAVKSIEAVMIESACEVKYGPRSTDPPLTINIRCPASGKGTRCLPGGLARRAGARRAGRRRRVPACRTS